MLQVNSKMAAGGVFQVFFTIVLACLFDQVSAFDGGDAAALIIGLIVGIMGICACLGAYARRQQGAWGGIQIELILNRGSSWSRLLRIYLWIFFLLLYIYGTSAHQLFIWLKYIFLVDILTRKNSLPSDILKLKTGDHELGSVFGDLWHSTGTIGQMPRTQAEDVFWQRRRWWMISYCKLLAGF